MQREIFELHISKTEFHQKALSWAAQFDEISFFNSNDYSDKYSSFEFLLAVKSIRCFTAHHSPEAVEDLTEFIQQNPHTIIPGYWSYELKNSLENTFSIKAENDSQPEMFFFVPEIIIRMQEYGRIEIFAPNPKLVWKEIIATNPVAQTGQKPVQMIARWRKKDYEKAFERVQKHINQGDIYEVNLCQEFYATNVNIHPFELYLTLNAISPTPFSSFFKWKSNYIISASPERYLCKKSQEIVSQPIKGTAKRGKNVEEDLRIKEQLRSSPKEQAENVMIVDLVRNDLTRTAIPGTVKVEKLFEIQTFPLVHQMVSTISAQCNPQFSNTQILASAFPPGSMTGAPKISAMKIIDNVEASKRGLYSGSLGYFNTFNGDFDFNVLIRSFVYNEKTGFLSFHTGGAITTSSYCEDEYQECILKAKALTKALGAEITVPE